MFCSHKNTLCNLALDVNFWRVFLRRAAHGKTAKNMTKNLCGRDGERWQWVLVIQRMVDIQSFL